MLSLNTITKQIFLAGAGLALLAVLGLPAGARAGETIIKNDIQVEANTGGNQGDTVQEGRAEAEASIRTEINGQTVTDEYIKKESKENIMIGVDSHTQATDKKAETKTTTRVNSQEETSEGSVGLDNPGSAKTGVPSPENRQKTGIEPEDIGAADDAGDEDKGAGQSGQASKGSPGQDKNGFALWWDSVWEYVRSGLNSFAGLFA
jgi:hypothetical protein